MVAARGIPSASSRFLRARVLQDIQPWRAIGLWCFVCVLVSYTQNLFSVDAILGNLKIRDTYPGGARPGAGDKAHRERGLHIERYDLAHLHGQARGRRYAIAYHDPTSVV